jgi:secondary thiamine-phosphate synthase enzyme
MEKHRQVQISLSPKKRGFHIITDEVLENIDPLPKQGLVHIFIRHTSAGICINENADPTVLDDFRTYFDRLAPEHLSGIKHTLEGPDDMPSHIKSVLCGNDLTIPVINNRLGLGTWQGIYLCEFRNHGGSRKLVATIISF